MKRTKPQGRPPTPPGQRPTGRPRKARQRRPGWLLREQYPFWDDLVEIWRNSPEPQTEQQRYIAEQFMHCLDGALAYWRRVEADMDAAAVELKIIASGKTPD
jgi:hypothetical protein